MVIDISLRTQFANAETRDQLYDSPDVFQIVKFSNKTLSGETLSTQVQNQSIYNGTNDSFVLGHQDNGKLGTANGIGGTQIVLGDYRGTSSVERVTNPNNTFKDYVRDTQHWDTTNSTASVDTTNHKISF